MKVAAFVPVKLNNERTPGKNTKRFFNGKALLTVFLETLSSVRGVDEAYVFCSDPSIREYLVPGIGYLERPKYLDTQKATPQDIIGEFMRLIEADAYMVCHCTSPFVTREHLEECVSAVRSGGGGCDSAFTAERIQKHLWSSGGEPLNFDPALIPRTQDLDPIYSEVSAAYAFRREVFQDLRRRVGLKPHVVEVSGFECIDIDYPEDFALADDAYRLMLEKGRG